MMYKRLKARLIGLAAAVAGFSTVASAALPPKYQRLRELEAVLAAPEVTNAFPDTELITGIEYLRPDIYRVRSAKCRLDVTLKDKPLPGGMVGPRQFTLRPGKIVCNRA